jgi:predicted dehydrogenase
MVKRRRLPESSQTALVDADDNFALMIRFNNGALGTIHYTATAPQDTGDEIILSGSDGMLMLRADGVLVGARRDEELRELPIPARLQPEIPEFTHPSANPTYLLAKSWIHSIRTGAPATPSFEDGVKVQEVLDGVVRSTQLGRWIEVTKARFQY